MALPQQKFREVVFQLLYSEDFAKAEAEDMLGFMMNQLAITKKTMREALGRKEMIVVKFFEIDRMIEETSEAYAFERISRVERNILRLSVFELFFDEAVPPKVAIAEAIRLCRKFGTAQSANFVNAILDTIWKHPSYKAKHQAHACTV